MRGRSRGAGQVGNKVWGKGWGHRLPTPSLPLSPLLLIQVSSSLPPFLSGATALARDLQALLECPPEPPEGADDALGHTDSGSGGREPVQLGPLPRSLVEDFMRLMLVWGEGVGVSVGSSPSHTLL